MGASRDSNDWSDPTRVKQLLFRGNANLAVGARFSYDVPLSSRFSLDLGPSFEWHKTRVSKLATTFYPSASTNLLWFGVGPTVRLILDQVEPFLGVDIGYGVFLVDGIDDQSGAKGLVFSVVGGQFARASDRVAVGCLFRYSRIALDQSGLSVGVVHLMTAVLTLKLNF